MAPKGKSNRDDLKQEDVLQAVVIADSFNIRFAPITKKKPRALLPLVNLPVLDYTLDWLCSSGVQEIFVVCCAHRDQIRKYIQSSRWSSSTAPYTVTPVLSEDCLSVGDALREVDAKGLIRSDFILVSGDVVANINLHRILEEHKKRREKDKSALMTMVYKKASPGHQSRCKEDDMVIAVDKATNRVLNYQKCTDDRKFHFPVEILTGYKEIELRYDLLDCQISVCTPQVPQLFTDNFDYLNREDFVKGILINEEILGNTIYINIITDEYAARISNFQMYASVSNDIISRWTYPHVPDICCSVMMGDIVSHGRHNIYLSKDVTLARGCILEENVVLGSGTQIGSGTTISHSVVGQNCVIGENVTIKGAFLWDGVKVASNSIIERAILCDDVTVLSGVTVKPGTVLSWQVKVGPDVIIPEGTRLHADPDAEGEDGESSQFGRESHAYVYRAPCDSDDEEELVDDMWGLTIHSDEEGESTETSGDSDDSSEIGSLPPDDSKLFYAELIDTMVRAKEENISADNVILEINSLKHAYYIQIREVNQSVIKVLLDLPAKEYIGQPVTLSHLKTYLTKQLPLVKNYINSLEAQMDALTGLEEFYVEQPSYGVSLVRVLQLYYDWDVIEEDAIMKWYNSDIMEMAEADDHKAIRKQVAPLIKWLQEAAEEDSDDED